MTYPQRRVKNAAYAWRQMLFLSSMASEPEQERFTRWVVQHANWTPGPIVDGLVHVLEGGTLEPRQRFLGWTVGPHPALAAGIAGPDRF